MKQLFLYYILERSGNHNVDYYVVDLSDFTSIRTFVEYFKVKEKSLDILINNAGKNIKT